MAELKFVAFDTDNKSIPIENVISYELSTDEDAPCDGLRLYFVSDNMTELYRLEVFNTSEKIFNGYVDTQRETVNDSGCVCFLYARSSACILTDNEARPFTYINPSARSLCMSNAKDLGFNWRLPHIFCESDYSVSKGTSCFGAINNFVYGATGKHIRVNAENCITLAGDGEKKSISAQDIMSEKRIINRGDALCRIDYKALNTDDYNRHIKSRFADDRKIRTSKKQNLASLPDWQREYTLTNALKSACASYYQMELVLGTSVQLCVGDIVSYTSSTFGKLDDYIVSSLCFLSDAKGVRTNVKMRKNIDLREIVYVD
jgi:hypothetical protein